MSNLIKSALFGGALAAAAIGVSVAKASPPEVCRDYATASVRQALLARSIPACDHGLGPRWTTDYRVHYDWCLGAPFEDVAAERLARTNWLRSCRG